MIVVENSKFVFDHLKFEEKCDQADHPKKWHNEEVMKKKGDNDGECLGGI